MVDLDSRPAPTPYSEACAVLNMYGMEWINLGLFRLSNGRVGGSIWGTPVVLLTAGGRRSGTRRTKPLLAMEDGDSWILVGSRGGTSKHPDWFTNLLAFEQQERTGESPTLDGERLEAPEVTAEGGRTVTVRTEVLEGKERDRWWDRLVSVYPKFASYQDRSSERRIPVLRVSPAR